MSTVVSIPQASDSRPDPEQIAHYEAKLAFEIDSWDLSLALKAGQDVVVIDTRAPTAYEREHIAGAVSFPHKTMSPESTAELRRDCLYVTYCDGIGCNGSTKGALKMARLGFTVKELIGGLDWWKRDGHPTEGNEGKAATGEACGC